MRMLFCAVAAVLATSMLTVMMAHTVASSVVSIVLAIYSVSEGDYLNALVYGAVAVAGIIGVCRWYKVTYQIDYVGEKGIARFAGGSGSDFGTSNSYGIDMDNLKFSNTVQNYTGRPYQNSKLLINEIIECMPPILDTRGTNAWSWTVEGAFNGSTGYYELIIDPNSNSVWHFVFKSQ